MKSKYRVNISIHILLSIVHDRKCINFYRYYRVLEPKTTQKIFARKNRFRFRLLEYFNWDFDSVQVPKYFKRVSAAEPVIFGAVPTPAPFVHRYVRKRGTNRHILIITRKTSKSIGFLLCWNNETIVLAVWLTVKRLFWNFEFANQISNNTYL